MAELPGALSSSVCLASLNLENGSYSPSRAPDRTSITHRAPSSRFAAEQMEIGREDWNEDFEFDFKDTDQAAAGIIVGHDEAVARFSSVVVPQAIKERQANVHGDLSHVKDFAVLVEELKRLRAVAIAKDIIDGPSADLWAEADDIIDLATSDTDAHTAPPPLSPSSPAFGFDRLGFDPFDDEPFFLTSSSRSRRKSVLSLDDGFFGRPPATSGPLDRPTDGLLKTSHSLPRIVQQPALHDPQSGSPSLIETIHQRKLTSSSQTNSTTSSSPRKMPFDSTTLRELVAHVRVLSRRLADVVRAAESPPSSPSHTPLMSPAPSFTQVLAGSVASSPTFTTGRPSKKSISTSNVLAGPIKGKDNELGGHILMAVI